MKKEELLSELSNILKECDKWLLLTCEDCDELAIKKLINKMRLEYYFMDNTNRMNSELKSLKLIPDNKQELETGTCHRIYFDNCGDKIYYQSYK